MIKKRVVVAMSGGVDSSLVAALLLEKDYDVIGVTLRLYEESSNVNSIKNVDDAKKVAKFLGISHYVINLEDMFKKRVINYFLNGYINGTTPNPCIACNRYIKFEELFKRARDIGADYVATGHYACIEHDDTTNKYRLRKGHDLKKDQSYVLYHLNQDILSRFLLPLGKFNKETTRTMAIDYGIPVANKPDSQEICFIPNDDYKEFIKKYSTTTVPRGSIIDLDGKVLGEHDGIPFYTIGQRKGLGISSSNPLYVVDIISEDNKLVVGSEDMVFGKELLADNIVWIDKVDLSTPIEVNAKIRYGKKESPAIISLIDEDKIKVIFKEKQRAITPGQSVVFYENDYVLGGGIIIKSSL